MLKQRVITALCIAPPLIAAIFYLPTNAFAVLMVVVGVLASYEWMKLSRPVVSDSVSLVVLGLIVVLAGAVIFVPSMQVNHAAAFVIAIVGVLLWLFLFLRLTRSTRWPAMTHEGLLLGVASVLLAMLALVYLHRQPLFGPAIVFSFLLSVAAADIGAYFSGKRYGRVKLAPTLSPGKTREGVVGGVVTAAIVCAIVFCLSDFPSQQSWLVNAMAGLFAGVITACISVIGDLYASFGKRHAGVKDSGRLLPGHGGILDRIDAMLAGAPVFTAIVLILGLLVTKP